MTRTTVLVAVLVVAALAAGVGVLVVGSRRLRWTFQAPYDRGRMLWKLRRFDEAIEQFAKTLEREPDHVEALRGTARCYQGKGDLKRAAAWAERAAEHDATAQAHTLRAEIALRAAGVWGREPDRSARLTDRQRGELQRLVEDAQTALASGRKADLTRQQRHDLWRAIQHAKAALEVDPEAAPSGAGRYHVAKAAEHALAVPREDPDASLTDRRPSLLDRVAEHARQASGPDLSDRERYHLQKAVEHAQAGLKLDPRHGPAYRALAQAVGRLGDMTAAMEQIGKAIEVEPDARRTRLVAAELLWRQGKPRGALRQLRHLLDTIDPSARDPQLRQDRRQALRDAAETLLELGQCDDVIALCKEMPAAGEASWRVHYYLGHCYLRKEDHGRAVAESSQAVKRLGAAAHPGPYWVRGQALMKLGRFGDAAMDFRSLVNLYAREGAKDAWVYLQLGEAYAADGQLGEARDAFLEAIGADPLYFPARAALAGLLADGGRVGEALALLRQGLQAAGDSPEAYSALVHFCRRRGLSEEAEKELRRLLGLYPESPELTGLLADLYLHRGEAEEALPLARYALQREPTSAWLAHLAAQAEAAYGNYKVAADLFAEAVRLDPARRAAYFDWARMREEQGDAVAAEDVYERALRALQNPVDVRVASAKLHLATGREAQGIAALRAIVDGHPHEFPARAALVEHLLARGDLDAALQEAEAALRSLPERVAAHSLLARVHRARGEWHRFLALLDNVARRIDPNAVLAYQRLAAYVHEGRYAEAVAVGRDALARHPQRKPTIRLDVAVAQFLAGQHGEAIEAARLAVADDPYDADAGFVLSLMELAARDVATQVPACRQDAVPQVALAAWADLARLNAKRPDEARRITRALLEAFVFANAGWHDVAAERCASILEFAPHSLMASVLAPVLWEQAGQREKALAAARRAVARNPTANEPRALLADLLLLEGDTEQVVDLYARPVGGPLPPIDLLVKRALLVGALGRHDDAVAAWRTVLRYEPLHVQAANNLAWLLATGPEPDLAEAVRSVSVARERAPANAAVVHTCGRVLSLARQHKDAIEALEQAVELAPYTAVYHFDLGMAYARVGREDEADEALRRAIQLDPEGEFVNEALRIIASFGG